MGDWGCGVAARATWGKGGGSLPLWLWVKLLQALAQAQPQLVPLRVAAACHRCPQALLCIVQQVLAGLKQVHCVEVVQQQLLTHTTNTSTTVCRQSGAGGGGSNVIGIKTKSSKSSCSLTMQ